MNADFEYMAVYPQIPDPREMQGWLYAVMICPVPLQTPDWPSADNFDLPPPEDVLPGIVSLPTGVLIALLWYGHARGWRPVSVAPMQKHKIGQLLSINGANYNKWWYLDWGTWQGEKLLTEMTPAPGSSHHNLPSQEERDRAGGRDALSSVVVMERIGNDMLGQLITKQDFHKYVKEGMLTDDDGFGEYATSTHVANKAIHPSDLDLEQWDDRFTHVMWYNK